MGHFFYLRENHIMRKVKLYIATSLNGKIARLDGSIDWLESMSNPDKTDHGYADFLQTIDTTIQGRKTYEQLMSWGPFPYPDKTNYVFTTNSELEDSSDVQFVSAEHIEFTKALKKQPGKDIWIIGGGALNTTFLNARLIDEIQVFVMPIVLPAGIELFSNIPEETHLELLETKSYSTGAVELKYAVRFS